MVAIESYGDTGPVAADRVVADKFEAQVSEERDRCVDVADGNANVF